MPEVKEKEILELDLNNLSKDQVNRVLYRFMRQDRDNDGARVIAKALSDMCNGGGSDAIKILVEESMRDHRTLIQAKMGFVFKMIATAARDYREDNYDGRNEYSFRIASEIYNALSTGDCGRDGRYHRLNMGTPLI